MEGRLQAWGACAAATTIVGSSFGVSALLVDYPVYGGQAIRYAAAAVILLCAIFLFRAKWLWPTGREFVRLALLAASGLAAFNICVIEATRYIKPSVVGAVVGATPIVLAILGPLLERRRIQATVLLAAVFVTAGVLLVEGGGAADPRGLLLAFGALAGEIAFSVLAVPLLVRLGPLLVATYVCCLAPPLLLVTALWMSPEVLAVPTWTEAGSLAYLAIAVTALAFFLWYRGLQRLGSALAGLFVGLMPLTALATSVALGIEELTVRASLGCGLVAIALVVGLGLGRDRPELPLASEEVPVAR